MLVVPPHFKSMDPNWASCSGYFLGWRDPPLAFGPTSTIDLPKITATRTSPPNQQKISPSIGGEAAPGSVPTLPAKATPLNGNGVAETALTKPSESPSNISWQATETGSGRVGEDVAGASILGYDGQFRRPDRGDQEADRTNMQLDPSRDFSHSPGKPMSSVQQNRAAKSHWSSLLAQGLLGSIPGAGRFISAGNDGLVVGNAKTMATTIPYSSLLIHAGSGISTMELGQIASLVDEAYQELSFPGSNRVFRPKATNVSSPIRHGRAKNGGENMLSQSATVLRCTIAEVLFSIWLFCS
jgi:hypothetical protein